MHSFLAEIFRVVFKIPFFKKRFFGIHQRLIFPYSLFKGVKKRIRINDIEFDLDIDDWIPENLYFLGEYEASELRELELELAEGSVFVDVGANIGLYTLNAAKWVGEKGKVISFEPFASNFSQLQHNVLRNKFTNVVLENRAVAQSDKQISIAYDATKANKGMASSYVHGYTHMEQVQSTTLDLYFEQHPVERIDFIKIDIEGGEYDALLGMKETLRKYRPTLMIEIDKNILSRTPYTEQQILDFLNELEYAKYEWERRDAIIREKSLNFIFKTGIWLKGS